MQSTISIISIKWTNRKGKKIRTEHCNSRGDLTERSVEVSRFFCYDEMVIASQQLSCYRKPGARLNSAPGKSLSFTRNICSILGGR